MVRAGARSVELARGTGGLTMLQVGLLLLMPVHLFYGELDAATR